MTDEIVSKLASFIAKDILKEPRRVISPQDALISSGLIGSFCLVDMALFVEDTFSVQIADTELNATTFDSLAELAALIRSRM
jgi:acyl carrier protein